MGTEFDRHCSDADLELYAMNQLGEAGTETLEEHILICESCQNRLDETDRYVRAMKAAASRLREEPGPVPVTFFDTVRTWLGAHPLPVWAGAAAMVCLVAVFASLYRPDWGAANEPLFEVRMTPVRGAEQSAAPAGRRLDLKLDLRGLDQSAIRRAELVDSQGAVLETSPGTPAADALDFRPSRKLTPGIYFVRVYGSSPDFLREYELAVK